MNNLYEVSINDFDGVEIVVNGPMEFIEFLRENKHIEKRFEAAN